MTDDVRDRMSCPKCKSQHVPFNKDGSVTCGGCGEKLRYVPGRFVIDCSFYEGGELLAFNHGVEYGLSLHSDQSLDREGLIEEGRKLERQVRAGFPG